MFRQRMQVEKIKWRLVLATCIQFTIIRGQSEIDSKTRGITLTSRSAGFTLSTTAANERSRKGCADSR